MNNEKIYNMQFSKIYPLLLNKVQKKGHTKEETYMIINWLCGYSEEDINNMLDSDITYRKFFENAPLLNPNRKLITGTICKIKVEDVQDPLMQNIRYLDKLIDELAKGKQMEKILRK